MRLIIPGRDERGDPELVEEIAARIRRDGPIPFAEFMLQALQHPTRGYYRRGHMRAGHGGDFLTAPEAHPAFAGAVARQLEACGEAIGATPTPAPTWIEAGAGTGTMANLVATSLDGKARVIALDSMAAPRGRPLASLVEEGHAHAHEGGAKRVRSDRLPFADGSIVGGIYANELLDALPVHRLRRAGAGWRELFVAVEGDRFVSVEREPTAAAADAAARADRRGVTPIDGQLVEVCPAAEAWIRDAARVLGRGFLLLFDYGDDTPRLWSAARRAGTLRCFAAHAVHEDPFKFVGQQDLTAHVDFGAIVEAARGVGLAPVAFRSQREWLDDWGLGEAGARLAERDDVRPDEVDINRHAIEFLRDARGLGAVRVLALAKGLVPAPIAGLTTDVPPARRFTPATLPLTRLPDPFADLY